MAGRIVRCVAALAAAALVAGCGGKREEGSGKAALRPAISGVEVVTVQPVPREAAVEAIGVVRAKTVASVAPQVMGRLTSIPVSEGAHVQAGQLLATIDDQAARAQLASAEGALAEAEGGKEEVERAVAQAEASRDLAVKTHERYRKLLEDKVVTPQEYDEVALRRTVAEKDYERAQRKAAQADGRVAQARGAVEAARAQAGYAKVTAPFAGVVIEKKADAGSMAVPGVPLFVLEDSGRRRIEASVSEAYLPLLKVGAPVGVILDDAPDNVLRASVSEISPSIDPATRTFIVKADLPAGKGSAGQSGRIRFASGKGTALAVPKRAITRAGGSEGVFVIGAADNVARLTFVTTGAQFGDRVEVLSGISPGDRVAVSPDRLSDGAVVGKAE